MQAKEAESESIDEERQSKGSLRVEAIPSGFEASRRRKRRWRICRCCLSCGAVLILLAIIMIVLALTVFKAKDPVITLNSVTIDDLNANFDLPTLTVHINLTLTADTSIKNTNKAASFKHGNSTTLILYRGKTVGQALIPPGTLKADRTARMNVSVTVFVDAVLSSASEFIRDGISGSLNMTTRTEISGRANVLHLIKKHVTVIALCDITVDVSSRSSEVLQCKKSYKL
ncbi:hypothetical protein SUGI_0951870 [Cryptomeria japonica]|uniref:uncharacterized protein LOC131060990 n=1 Tax=Cryptomeria japonica TaxID=3369 RepID=UPI0024148A15|nr:uncharacterized protein LOC131060990 [Cryptomeria japonica]GLJ45226.1 hypothetical protein SUGI_0951870 [Cryptomeria japonica]